MKAFRQCAWSHAEGTSAMSPSTKQVRWGPVLENRGRCSTESWAAWLAHPSSPKFGKSFRKGQRSILSKRSSHWCLGTGMTGSPGRQCHSLRKGSRRFWRTPFHSETKISSQLCQLWRVVHGTSWHQCYQSVWVTCHPFAAASGVSKAERLADGEGWQPSTTMIGSGSKLRNLQKWMVCRCL